MLKSQVVKKQEENTIECIRVSQGENSWGVIVESVKPNNIPDGTKSYYLDNKVSVFYNIKIEEVCAENVKYKLRVETEVSGKIIAFLLPLCEGNERKFSEEITGVIGPLLILYWSPSIAVGTIHEYAKCSANWLPAVTCKFYIEEFDKNGNSKGEREAGEYKKKEYFHNEYID